MDFDVDAAVRQMTAQLDALREAEQTPPEQVDTSRLVPVFVPASFCSKTWCGPYYRLRNPDVGLTWCVLREDGIISYVNHRQKVYWDSKGLDWKGLALANLVKRSQGQQGITVLNNARGEARAISFRFADGLGSSHLLRRGLLSQQFPNGYRVALPDRSYGLAYSADLGPEELSTMRKAIDLCHSKGSYALSSGDYEPDQLLPEKISDLEKHLARLGQNPRAEVQRVVMDAYRRGDYEEAVRQAEGLKLLGEVTASYCLHRGTNLGHLGLLEEAEVWLRRNIAMNQEDGKTKLHAIALTALARVMLQAARYQEAEECIEKSIALWPERGTGYRYRAELRLLRGDGYTDALQWAESAVSREYASGNPAYVQMLNVGEHLAVLAWATAAASRDPAAVARLAGEAVAAVGDTVIESTAEVRYHLGRAFTELGDRQTAAEHYAEAARLDPNGHWGRAGKSALG
jgi:tetratricopeptide (TPR) repeat protein